MTGPEERRPYVGEGSDGARRSANIDLEELGTLDAADPRRDTLEESRQGWLDQAARLEELGR